MDQPFHPGRGMETLHLLPLMAATPTDSMFHPGRGIETIHFLPMPCASPTDPPFHPGRGRRDGGRGRGWVADLPCCALHPPRAARCGPIHEAMGGHGSAIPPSASAPHAPATLAQLQRTRWRFRAQGPGILMENCRNLLHLRRGMQPKAIFVRMCQRKGGPARVSCVEMPILRTRRGSARVSCVEKPILRTRDGTKRASCVETPVLRTRGAQARASPQTVNEGASAKASFALASIIYD